jgi:hypothetical protein
MSKPFKQETITTAGAEDEAVGEATFTGCGGFLMRVYAVGTGQPSTAVLTLTDVQANYEIMSAPLSAFQSAGGSLAIRLLEHDEDGTALTSRGPYFMTGIHNAADRSILAEVTLGDDAGTVDVKLQFAGREGV